MDFVTGTFICLCLLTVACIEENTYSQVDDLSGKIPTGVSPITVRSLSDCAASCSGDVLCQGFYYSQTSGDCFIESTYLSTLINESDALYFEKADWPMVCPDTFDENVRFVGSSGTWYTYTFYSTLVDQFGAASTCNVLGLNLIKLNDVVKIRELRDFLISCPVYGAYSYWTDAERHDTDNITTWTNSDGDELPSEYWCNGSAGYHTNENCARLSNYCNDFKMHDRSCSYKGYAIICE